MNDFKELSNNTGHSNRTRTGLEREYKEVKISAKKTKGKSVSTHAAKNIVKTTPAKESWSATAGESGSNQRSERARPFTLLFEKDAA